ncbi:rho guanine nucleotide exchange factor 33-like [Amia ocellicauda]|uniref:rho guanine nucleotide exchange factor 33-like n=1 Tax=Amia ocellicauda TaxID=2972642 RepID=UPI003463C28E
MTALEKACCQVQGMVSELKADFSSALLELSRIQHGDAQLRESIEQSRQQCSQEGARLQALVFSLKHELGEALCHIRQLSDRQQQLQQVLEATQLDRGQVVGHLVQQSNR